MTSAFGNILRDWRKQRRMSQLDLGLDANVSARHISFIEQGRSKPSREMVLNLTQCLQMPKAQTNQAFLAAGYAPVFQQHANNNTNLAQIHSAINIMLENHMPYPAIVMDNHWNIINANECAQSLLVQTGFAGHKNLIKALISDTPEKSSIENWHEAVTLILQRLKVELFHLGEDETLSQLTSQLEGHLDLHSPKPRLVDFTQAVIPTRFRIGKNTISVFSTLAQFGSVFDLTLADLKIELMFPADDETKKFFTQSI